MAWGIDMRRAVAITAAFAGALLVTGCSGANSNPLAESKATATPLESYAPAAHYNQLIDPNRCDPVTEDVLAPVSVVECHNFTLQAAATQQRILKDEQTPVAEYAKLPYVEQYFYASYLLENRAGEGQVEANNVVTHELSGGSTLTEWNNALPSTPDGSVINQISLKLAALQAMRTTDASGRVTFDKENALKALAGIAVPGSQFYETLLNLVENNPSGNSFSYNTDGSGFVILNNQFAVVLSKDSVDLAGTGVPSYTVRTTAQIGPSIGDISLQTDIKLRLAQVQPTDASGKSKIDYLLYELQK